uniref:Uncharacterized protein n=1 Tax=Hyaloperonospora arabidopsidis (strain Emoy2) TaxID=559515 RepID=M4BTE4_HYAAE
MELRHRAKGATKKSARGLDVALGPTIYSGERYSKMSERLRRQQKNPSDVADASAQRVAFLVERKRDGRARHVFLRLISWVQCKKMYRKNIKPDEKAELNIKKSRQQATFTVSNQSVSATKPARLQQHN